MCDSYWRRRKKGRGKRAGAMWEMHITIRQGERMTPHFLYYQVQEINQPTIHLVNLSEHPTFGITA